MAPSRGLHLPFKWRTQALTAVPPHFDLVVCHSVSVLSPPPDFSSTDSVNQREI